MRTTKIPKVWKNRKKDVDKGGGEVVRYTSAREERVPKGSRCEGARWTLKTIQKSKKEERQSIEMSFNLVCGRSYESSFDTREQVEGLNTRV